MENNFQEPQFQDAQTDDIMREHTFALMAESEGQWFASGTATLIGPQLALTAKHVVEDYEERFGRFSVLAANILEGGTVGALWSVNRYYSSPFTDITLLFLCPAPGSKPAEGYDWAKCPVMNLAPPEVGSVIWGFGYPNSQVKIINGEVGEQVASGTTRLEWSDKPTITTGEVMEVYYDRRDSCKMPYPAFETNARFDGSMSGGPVFNESGELCGIIGTGYDPHEDGDRWATFVSSLWPLMGLQLDVPIVGRERGTYLLSALANVGYIHTLNLDKVIFEMNEDGSVYRVGFEK